MMKQAIVRLFIFSFALIVLQAGCTTLPAPAWLPDSKRHRITKPVVAVMKFENKADFHGKWKLGDGMADILTTELLKIDRFTVLERQHLDDVVGELVRQGRDFFRKEGRAEKGRLKNAKYLIRGAITDFTVTGDASGWFGYGGSKAEGRGSRARVSLHIRVSDVETGEIIASVNASDSVSSGWFGGKVNYKRLSFGGDAFFRTPLGRATEKSMRKCLKRILRHMPTEYWQSRVAEAGPDYVVINGGTNVRLREGDEYLVREKGRDIFDPVSGNVIETVPGNVIGKVVVQDVRTQSAHAVILEGHARRGSFLERIEK